MEQEENSLGQVQGESSWVVVQVESSWIVVQVGSSWVVVQWVWALLLEENSLGQVQAESSWVVVQVESSWVVVQGESSWVLMQELCMKVLLELLLELEVNSLEQERNRLLLEGSRLVQVQLLGVSNLVKQLKESSLVQQVQQNM